MERLSDYYPSHLEGYELYEANQDHMFPEFMYYYAELKVYLQKLLQTEFEGRSIPSEFSIGSCGDEEIFAALQQHLDFGTLNSAGEACDKAAAYDLAVLLRYLAPMYRVNIVPTLTSVLLHESPLIRYDKLWLLFRPGTYVYFRQSINDTTLSGAVVAQSFYESYSRPASIVRRNIESTARLVLDLWIVRHNNESFQLVHNNFSINRFEGPRHVKALHVVPADLHDKFDQGATREKLEKRGRKYLSILSEPAPYAYRNYDHPRSGVCGKIIVDEETYMRYSTPKPPPGPHPGPHSGAPAGPYRGPPPPQGPPATEDDSGGGRFRDLLAFTPSSSKDYHRIKEVYPLLPRYVRGLELKSKNWMTFEVDYISDSAPAAPPNQLDSELVLVFDADKEALRTVLKNGEKNLTVPSDFVPGKGEGKIFLLYGPPGTGKTLTVECIANDTGRPLISLGVHNIGQITEDIENRLRNWFTLAARWNAILLIDEADIFLEQRQEGNYGRNSLSTIFLRTMEYYKGVLFLTTNRPGHIDDSFISRITCPILYQELSLETKAKIINRFLRKFEENGDIEVENAAKSYLVSHCQKLNGRQIRNVLQDALAASEVKHRADKLFDSQHEPARLVEEGSQIVKVKISYVKAAVERQLQFLGYQDELRQRPEALRAKSKHDYLLILN
ncbi:P-loop containing nucleoside triphosphate hydrolase protein [Thozetella sp. PMI_491]|nr:P-loop containing nucleoside triphosphate hydrolase protein [Thozetella sp. PMI_491]